MLEAILSLCRVPDVEAAEWGLRVTEVLLEGGGARAVEQCGGIDALEHIIYNSGNPHLCHVATTLNDKFFGEEYFGDEDEDDHEHQEFSQGGFLGGFQRGMSQKPAWMSQ